MKTSQGRPALTILAGAIQSVLMLTTATVACAQDESVADLTTPDNSVEVGVIGSDKDSNKFGEYSGLRKSGAEFLGNFSIRGGDYGSETGIRRWSVYGSNLGLTSRELGGSIGDQGKWNLGLDYDELQHNTTSGYQTPYNGSMGGNSFTLPGGFTAVGNTTLTTAGNLTATDYGTFHTVDVHNTRKNTTLTAGYSFSPHWRITLDYNNLEQSGAKLMAFSSDANLGVTGERIAILPNPTNYTTDNINLAVDWTGDKGHMTGAYFGSFFRDHYDRVNWTTFAGGLVTDTMSTAPSNDFHQFSLSGGYRFSPATKAAGSLSYGRNTQNSSYVASAADLVSVPQNSLSGKVVTTHGDFKLTHQTTKSLNLSAGLTYNKRDNQTQSNVYTYAPIGGGSYELPNTPYSHDKAQLELAADYRLGSRNSLRLAYDHDNLKRWCNSYGATAEYPAGTNCLVDTRTKEDKYTLGYKLKALETIGFSAGYIFSDRKTSYDTGARVTLDSLRGGTVLDPYAVGTIAGLNGGDYLGFHPLFDASRKQNLLKARLDWQASPALSLGVDGRYAKDDYADSAFGPQDGKSWNLTLDATYTYSENGSVFAYVTQDYRDRRINHVNRSNTTTSAYIWDDRLKDQGISYGLGFKQGGLLGNKFDIKGDLTFSDDKSNYSSDLLYTFTGGTTTAATCSAAAAMTCGSAPDIRNKLTQFKLTGTYKLDKRSKITIGYVYQKLSTTDYFYNAYQYPYTATSVLPTNQQPGGYTVNLVAASYTYSFK